MLATAVEATAPTAYRDVRQARPGGRVRRTAWLIVAIVALVGAGRGNAAGTNSFDIMDRNANGLAALYGGDPALVTAYATAMRHCRTAGQQELTCPFFATSRPPAFRPWTWTARDGSVLTRVRQGVFRMALAAHAGDWFYHVDCADDGWPMFSCTDGRKRKMSTPDLSTVHFGGVEFRRELPPSE
ncbi:MAG: hypothetical protein K5872_05220 [Rhizobiaceae bacterium]|nr:hypothetical protein [Rhizobiaceae bacterium]MCV0405611.1 hypothetical protein [Rhizobiaceae bacterium]